jgi:hypothetical protein
MHFVDGNLKAKIYCDEAHCHHLMFQHDIALPHVSRIWKQFLEAVSVLPWHAYSDISPIEHVSDALDRCVRQRVPVRANSQKLHTTIEV